MTSITKNATLSVKEGDSDMKKQEKTKEELRAFANSETIYTIKELRDILGLSQIGFHKAYDVPRRSIENWESGISEPQPWIIKLLNRVVKEDIKHDLRYKR